MKFRLIAALLMLANVFGLFGCTAANGSPTENGGELPDGFISAAEDGFLAVEERLPENLINVAQTDEKGEAIFQIVYNIDSSPRVQDQCEALAADIYDATGVEIPVVHSMEKQKTYEITVGDIARRETIEAIDGFDLEDTDFAIQTVGTRVLIYAETDAALASGIIFFMEQAAYVSPLQGVYGLAADYRFVYHPNDVPAVRLTESADDRCVEFVLENGPSMYTYVRLSYTGNEGWRIQTKYRETDSFRDTGASQILAYSLGEHTLGEEDDRFYLESIATSRTGDILTVTSPDGSRVEIDLASFRMDFYTKSNCHVSGVTNLTHNAGGSSIVGDLEANEAIFGTGERFNSANQRGKRIEMFSKDIWNRVDACYVVIPLLCSSRGSGIFLNNYEHMMLDLDSKNQNIWRADITGAPLDCYVFTTDKIPDVIYGYCSLSGFCEMPEEWSYGMLVNAYGPDFAARWSDEITPSEDGRGEGVYEFIANMEAYDLPWTGIIAEGWSHYNSTKNPNHMKELCDYVHSLGKKFMVYFRVGTATGDMRGFEKSYLLTQTRSDGTVSYNLPDTTRDSNNPDAGSGVRTHVYVDVTDPRAMEWFFGEYWDYLSNEIGVDGCKIDFCETLPENYELNYFDENIPTAGSHHWYPTAFHNKFWDMISSKPDSGLCFTRGGGIGLQRAPILWAGDQVRFWDGIQWQLTATLSSGLSGLPFMSYDMSGYQYGSDPLYKEIAYETKVFLRGAQYSAFAPCVQSMGKVKRAYQFSEYEEPLLDGEGNEVKDADGNVIMVSPYTYATEIYRAYTKLHEHLTPYITELSKEACETGLPVMRHLILGWQDDENVWSIEDEYTFGDAFLIAPILTDATTRSVYLPEGVWEDLNTGAVYEVGAEGLRIDVTASIAELPTFFNKNTESEIAPELIDGIKEIYDYARSCAPAEAE